MKGFEKELKDEGFVHVYEWTDKPHTKYPAHKHRGKVSFYILKGSITMNFEDGRAANLKKGDHMKVPMGVTHTAEVGPAGCTFIVGEEIEGDS
ncbi:MAG: cupin domain-containing protein [Candidatus Aenigmatarchaeota archaeon]|nr:MAG: cupin domain-containing protein [Candidatus Aenigmarchaeota archaeon]